jgi:hypothetical protein
MNKSRFSERRIAFVPRQVASECKNQCPLQRFGCPKAAIPFPGQFRSFGRG